MKRLPGPKRLPSRVRVAIRALRGRPVMYRMAVYTDGGIGPAPGSTGMAYVTYCHLGLTPVPDIARHMMWDTELARYVVWPGVDDREAPR